MKINTWLPVFPGFYGTWFEPRLEDHVISDYWPDASENFDPLDYFDNTEYERDMAIECCKVIQSGLSDFLESVEFQAVSSPREYNFSNDSINCSIEFKESHIQSIKEFILEHLKEFDAYLRGNYTSGPGFVSHYDPEITEWLDINNNYTVYRVKGILDSITDEDDKPLNVNHFSISNALNDEHKAGTILQFLCEQLEITNDTLYEDCETWAPNYVNEPVKPQLPKLLTQRLQVGNAEHIKAHIGYLAEMEHYWDECKKFGIEPEE